MFNVVCRSVFESKIYNSIDFCRLFVDGILYNILW